MTDLNKAEMRRLAEAYAENPSGAHGEDGDFRGAANPTAILALLDELDNCSLSWGLLNAERDQLRAEVEALRKDSLRWQCVRNAIPMQSPYVVWREGSHVVLGKDADEMVDNFLYSAKEGSAND